MTLDETLDAYTAGLAAEIELLRQVEGLADAQHAAFARGELMDLAGFAAARARLMHELAAAEARLEPWRTRIRANLAAARRCPGFAVADARSLDAQALVRRLVDHDRKFLGELETTLDARRREVQDLDTGGATLAAYRRVVAPAPIRAGGLVDSRG
jgi:hypothetical protein